VFVNSCNVILSNKLNLKLTSSLFVQYRHGPNLTYTFPLSISHTTMRGWTRSHIHAPVLARWRYQFWEKAQSVLFSFWVFFVFVCWKKNCHLEVCLQTIIFQYICWLKERYLKKEGKSKQNWADTALRWRHR
jgi:hypothetical protein